MKRFIESILFILIKKHLHFEVKITVILDFDACVCVLALKSEMSLATEPKAS